MFPTWSVGRSDHAHTLFLAFDGATIDPADVGDARYNRSDIVSWRARIDPFDPSVFGGNPAFAEADIVAQVAVLVAPYDLRVVASRPVDDDRYVMVVVGGMPADIGAPDTTRGFAPLDCLDANPHDVVFVFAAALGADFVGTDPAEARQALAAVVAQESAHSYGLVHTDNTEDLMYPYVLYPPQEQRFRSGAVLGISCSSAQFQDSDGRLREVLGPRR
jgi:hypothetical protein